MKRQSLTRILILFSILLLFSCQSQRDTSSLEVAEKLTGLEAANAYQEFLSGGEDENVRWNLVYSLFEGEDYDGAKRENDIALSLYPDNIRFRYMEALILEKKELYREELSVLEAIRIDNPGNTELRERLLSLYSTLGELEKAKEEAWTIIEQDPKNKAALLFLSQDSPFFSALYEEQYGKSEEAEEASST